MMSLPFDKCYESSENRPQCAGADRFLEEAGFCAPHEHGFDMGGKDRKRIVLVTLQDLTSAKFVRIQPCNPLNPPNGHLSNYLVYMTHVHTKKSSRRRYEFNT